MRVAIHGVGAWVSRAHPLLVTERTVRGPDAEPTTCHAASCMEAAKQRRRAPARTKAGLPVSE